jgi:hypothetical protein
MQSQDCQYSETAYAIQRFSVPQFEGTECDCGFIDERDG